MLHCDKCVCVCMCGTLLPRKLRNQVQGYIGPYALPYGPCAVKPFGEAGRATVPEDVQACTCIGNPDPILAGNRTLSPT